MADDESHRELEGVVAVATTTTKMQAAATSPTNRREINDWQRVMVLVINNIYE